MDMHCSIGQLLPHRVLISYKLRLLRRTLDKKLRAKNSKFHVQRNYIKINHNHSFAVQSVLSKTSQWPTMRDNVRQRNLPPATTGRPNQRLLLPKHFSQQEHPSYWHNRRRIQLLSTSKGRHKVATRIIREHFFT